MSLIHNDKLLYIFIKAADCFDYAAAQIFHSSMSSSFPND